MNSPNSPQSSITVRYHDSYFFYWLDTLESFLTSPFSSSHLIHQQGLQVTSPKYLIAMTTTWPMPVSSHLDYGHWNLSFSPRLPLLQFNPLHTPCCTQSDPSLPSLSLRMRVKLPTDSPGPFRPGLCPSCSLYPSLLHPYSEVKPP